MLAICAYYAGITLNAFATYFAHNYAGIIGSSLSCSWLSDYHLVATIIIITLDLICELYAGT